MVVGGLVAPSLRCLCRVTLPVLKYCVQLLEQLCCLLLAVLVFVLVESEDHLPVHHLDTTLTSSYVALGLLRIWVCIPTLATSGGNKIPPAPPPHLFSASSCPPTLSSLPPPGALGPSPPPLLQLLPYTPLNPLVSFLPNACCSSPSLSLRSRNGLQK